MTVRNDITVDWTLSPRIVKVASPSTELTVQDLVDTLRYIEADLTNLEYDSIIAASGKEDLGGGVKVGITAELLNAKVMFEGRTTPLVTGTCTKDDTAGIILTDSSATFQSDGVYVGCSVRNENTKSSATIIEVLSETSVRTIPLSGGSSSSWTNGDSYRIYPNVLCSITGGNLVATDSNGNSMDVVLQSVNVQVDRTSSSSATLQELSNIQYSSFNGGVTIDTVNGQAGTTYPAGTLQQPVDNLADAKIIANERGFDTLFIIGDYAFQSTDNIDGFEIIGESPQRTNITLAAGMSTEGCEFENCTIHGTLDGDTWIRNCLVGDLTYIKGQIENSVLTGTVELAGNESIRLVNCSDGVPGINNLPLIDMGGSGRDLIVTDYDGTIVIGNLTANQQVELSIGRGHVHILDTVTAGTFVIHGIATVTNEGNVTSMTTDGLISKSTISEAVWGVSTGDYFTKNTMGGALLRILGLTQENFRIKNQKYNNDSLLVSASILVYSNATDVENNATPICCYDMSASYNANNECTAYRVIKK